MLIALPAYLAPTGPLNILDFIAAVSMLSFIILETIADQQQWDFHQKKLKINKDSKNVSEDLKKGFLHTGLFKYSRHPNFFGEISIWWCFYLFSQSLNYSIIGPILLTLLFQGSSTFTESITISKYPEYKVYQKVTSRLIPWIPGRWPQ